MFEYSLGFSVSLYEECCLPEANLAILLEQPLDLGINIMVEQLLSLFITPDSAKDITCFA
jgi:hypothetical protein